jgi:exodeoxyribonuclease VII large subunit
MPISLNVPFSEKNQAKALGARWNADLRKWEIPDDTDLAPFHQWLPAALAVVEPTTRTISNQRGVGLGQLMARVSELIEHRFVREEWVRVEVAEARSRSGHVYLHLTEHDARGRLVAKVPATIWASGADELLAKFKRDTGGEIAAGIKLLIFARVRFHAAYGLSLDVVDIDPSYTLGDMAAKLAEIRRRLIDEGIFNRQKSLVVPTDFFRILVISPSGAAGLGDFRREADALQRMGICTFIYQDSRFQGEGAASEIASAFRANLNAAHRAFDAIVLIRGGGAATDLHWLNEYELARAICECPVPVITGIGHERDNTILDEVAAIRCDTPSKVIALVVRSVQETSRKACAVFDDIRNRCQVRISAARDLCSTRWIDVQQKAPSKLASYRRFIDADMAQVRSYAFKSVREMGEAVEAANQSLRYGSRAITSKWQHSVTIVHAKVLALGPEKIRTARSDVVQTQLKLARGAISVVRRRHNDCDSSMSLLASASKRATQKSKTQVESTFREIVAQGPQRTLQRGFALVRDANNVPVTTAKAAIAASNLTIEFRDESVDTRVMSHSCN